MIGTPKQVRWAEDIIAEASRRIEEATAYWTERRQKKSESDARRKAAGKPDYSEKHKKEFDEIFAGLKSLEEYLINEDRASEIIDRRASLMIVPGGDAERIKAWASRA